MRNKKVNTIQKIMKNRQIHTRKIVADSHLNMIVTTAILFRLPWC